MQRRPKTTLGQKQNLRVRRVNLESELVQITPAARFGRRVSCHARALQQEPDLTSVLVFQRRSYPRLPGHDQ